MTKFSVYLCSIITFVVLSFTVPSTASAVVRYTYTGNNFTIVQNGYLTSMSVSGWFETNNPIPTNSAWPTNIIASMTSYSFFDGLQTLTPANSVVGGADVETNASGNIIQWTLSIFTFPESVGSPAGWILTYPLADQGLIGICTAEVGGLCSAISSGPADSIGQAIDSPGIWAMQIFADIVPTMNEWGMIIFMVLAGLGSVYYMRRKKIES